MLKNSAQTIYFAIRDATTRQPVTSGSPTASVAISGAAAASTNSPVYLSNNLWSLALTAAETNSDSVGIAIELASAETVSLTFFPRDSQLTSDRVSPSRTFSGGVEGYRSRNIITLNAWTTGTRTIAFDFEGNRVLNERTAIASVDSVTVIKDSDLSSITTTNLRRQMGLRAANADVAAITATGNYTCTAVVTTTDSQSLSMTGRLVVE